MRRVPSSALISGGDFARPEESFDYRLGVTPYVTPLIDIGAVEAHSGVVLGGLLDNGLRFEL